MYNSIKGVPCATVGEACQPDPSCTGARIPSGTVSIAESVLADCHAQLHTVSGGTST